MKSLVIQKMSGQKRFLVKFYSFHSEASGEKVTGSF